MNENKKLNMSIDDGKEFFAHEMSINFNPTQFVFDFRSVTPRIDPRTREGPVVALKHNIVLADPWHAKEILRVLTNVVKKYEEEFGEIKKPKAVEIYEKKAKKMSVQENEKTQTPSYMG